MRLAVVSDTHGHLPFTAAALRVIEAREADLVLHCGDIGTPAVVQLFASRATRFVFGNVDRDKQALRRSIVAAGLECDGEFGDLLLAGRRVAFLHGHDEQRLAATIDSGEFDLVLHGHTHRRRQEQIGRTLVVNPGALFRATPHSFAFIDLPTLDVEFVTVTGTP